MNKRDYTKYKFNEFVALDENSPSGLVWVAPRKYVNSLKYDRIGKPAGSIREFNKRERYWLITLFGKSFFCHRIIWLLYNGTINKEYDIDHIDGNSLNNNISNLREIPPILNCRNARKKLPNKELQTGVRYEELYSKKGTLLKRINAYVNIEPNKTIKKNFSVLKYGYDLALQKAIDWRNSMINNLNSLGAGYTKRHGT